MKCSIESFVLGVRRADTPSSKAARKFIDSCFTASVPVPRIFKPLGRLIYELRFLFPVLWKRFKSLVYTTPIFSCRCESVGKRLRVVALPDIHGHTTLFIGDDVRLDGSLTIASGRFDDRPVLSIGNRTFVGHNVSITCNREVIIEDDVLIAANCKISDYDGHPSSLGKRLANSLPDSRDIRPVRIGKGAWIGSGAFIFKGVTIGEGAVVGANSSVTHDVPPYCVAAGSPARVVKRVERPETLTPARYVSAAAAA